MTAYYAATLSRCEIIRAADETEGRRFAEERFGERLRVYRPASADEIDLHETWPAESGRAEQHLKRGTRE